MVLEAIHGPEACPPPDKDVANGSCCTSRVDLLLPEGSLLAAVAAATLADKDEDEGGEEDGPSSVACCLEFLCPKADSQGGGDYPAVPPLIRVSCSALPPSYIRRMTRRLSRLASAAAEMDQPMLHDLVSAASEMLSGDWHQQQPSVPSKSDERPRVPLDESSDDDEAVMGKDRGDEELGDWDMISGEEEEDQGDEDEEEADPEVEGADAAAIQAAAFDLIQQQRGDDLSVVDEAAEGGLDDGGGNSLVDEFDGLALGRDDDDTHHKDAADAKDTISQDNKPSAARRPGPKDSNQSNVKKSRYALSASAAEVENHKLASHQAWIEDSEAHGSMRRQRSALPAAGKRSELLEMLGRNHVVVISGATGCGKSTQVPQYILEDAVAAGRGARCNVIVTQPRRISALGLASRVAAERGEDVGQTVGYSVRLDTKQSARTRILFCTTGLFCVCGSCMSEAVLKFAQAEVC